MRDTSRLTNLQVFQLRIPKVAWRISFVLEMQCYVLFFCFENQTRWTLNCNSLESSNSMLKWFWRTLHFFWHFSHLICLCKLDGLVLRSIIFHKIYPDIGPHFVWKCLDIIAYLEMFPPTHPHLASLWVEEYSKLKNRNQLFIKNSTFTTILLVLCSNKRSSSGCS